MEGQTEDLAGDQADVHPDVHPDVQPDASPDDETDGQAPAQADDRAPAEPDSTGVPAADSALERLRDLDAAPLEDHVEIFDDVQRRLHEGLAELDDEQ